ncbi:carboxylesterase [Tropicimonas sp. IMCC34043]|uniref:alpha/beta hydrolase n=1 Tax=Tropicimonas sp. IMCC34043 TaxID=2248760 RepID=UPI000E278466|nr:alpha/beta hydrolase [Tropicimonas sp. IMCC34043]
MGEPNYMRTDDSRRIAWRRRDGAGPMVVFLGGLRSDMMGTKAEHLDAWAQARGQGFLRFDYSGHGESEGQFEDGCIGDWAEDAAAALTELTEGPLLLVGSSMGGWISLLMARAMPQRIAGLVTIAAAPDFTEDMMWSGFTDAQRAEMAASGQVAVPSDYGEPLVITQRLIEDGRNQLVLRDPLALPFPTRMFQGTADAEVDMSVALRILDHAEGPDIRLTLVKGADHRFSSPEALAMIVASIEEILTGLAAGSGSGGAA